MTDDFLNEQRKKSFNAELRMKKMSETPEL